MKEILLVEASPTLLSARQRTLEAEGYQVTGISSAAEAARAIRHGSYDLVIADSEVPEVLEVISSTMVPTLIEVDEERASSVAGQLPMGLWTLLVKPFTTAKFRQAVAEAIELANTVKDAMQQRVLMPLSETSKLLVSETEMDKFFQHLLEITAAETEADGTAVLILEERDKQLNVKAKLGLEPGSTDVYIRLGDWVMKMGKSLIVDERREADAYVREIMTELKASSLLSVPMLTRERAVGVICAVKVGKGACFSLSSLEFLSILAKQAATTIENTSLFKSVEKQREELQKLLETAVQSQENERKRLAIEIHDSIGQQLVGAIYRIHAFTHLLTQQKFAEALVEAEGIQSLLVKTLGELRRVLAGLRPDSLNELGLVSALRQEVDRLAKDTNMACQFTVNGSPVDLTPAQEAAIYRIVQEALSNIRKHAQATQASVVLCYQAEGVSVTVNDNGKGFKPDQATSNVPLGHMGLAGMKERAEMLRGNLRISSTPGNGTSVVLTIPLAEV